MELAHRIDAVRSWLDASGARSIGLVPTMGNLHEGHLALVRECRRHCDLCVVSIFVNPTQFGPKEDFANYPRTLEADLRLLDDEDVDVVFKPSVEEMYPDSQESHVTVSVPALANVLCGASRPGHFDGVATVVAKLFNIVRPHYAFFGEKDWQQLTVIRAMARQLDMPADVVGVPTVRAESGLALSSRNGYLTDDERERAALLHAALMDAKGAVESGEQGYGGLEARGMEKLAKGGFDIDYFTIVDADRLTRPTSASTRLRILAAARLGKARLIDNVGVER